MSAKIIKMLMYFLCSQHYYIFYMPSIWDQLDYWFFAGTLFNDYRKYVAIFEKKLTRVASITFFWCKTMEMNYGLSVFDVAW